MSTPIKIDKNKVSTAGIRNVPENGTYLLVEGEKVLRMKPKKCSTCEAIRKMNKRILRYIKRKLKDD